MFSVSMPPRFASRFTKSCKNDFYKPYVNNPFDEPLVYEGDNHSDYSIENDTSMFIPDKTAVLGEGLEYAKLSDLPAETVENIKADEAYWDNKFLKDPKKYNCNVVMSNIMPYSVYHGFEDRDDEYLNYSVVFMVVKHSKILLTTVAHSTDIRGDYFGEFTIEATLTGHRHNKEANQMESIIAVPYRVLGDARTFEDFPLGYKEV